MLTSGIMIRQVERLEKMDGVCLHLHCLGDPADVSEIGFRMHLMPILSMLTQEKKSGCLRASLILSWDGKTVSMRLQSQVEPKHGVDSPMKDSKSSEEEESSSASTTTSLAEELLRECRRILQE